MTTLWEGSLHYKLELPYKSPTLNFQYKKDMMLITCNNLKFQMLWGKKNYKNSDFILSGMSFKEVFFSYTWQNNTSLLQNEYLIFFKKKFEARIVYYNNKNNQVFDFLILMVYVSKTRYWTFDNHDHQLWYPDVHPLGLGAISDTRPRSGNYQKHSEGF